MSDQLRPGATAPAFTLPDGGGRKVSLADYADGNVVVYFYPKAATPGCTTEACDFRDNLNSLKSAGYAVVGISPDEPEAIAAFTADQQLNFPLLSDPDHAVAKAWGAFGEKEINGRTSSGTLRSTVVLGPGGTVRLAEYNVTAQGHVARLRTELGI
jgi:peroxiredoxin Q/BCP